MDEHTMSERQLDDLWQAMNDLRPEEGEGRAVGVINDLCFELAEWQDGRGTREDAERAICRAASEISGLTAWVARRAADQCGNDDWGPDEEDIACSAVLRHYAQLAELAREET